MKKRDVLTRIICLMLPSTGLLLPAMSARASESPAQVQPPHCTSPVFYAQTMNHKKEVEICLVMPGVSYTFGKVCAKNKEMNLTVPADSTTYAYQSNQVISLQEFTVRNGDTRYQVSAGTNDDGGPVASLYVYKGTPETGKLLAEIKLEPGTVVNNISHALAEKGIPEADSL